MATLLNPFLRALDANADSVSGGLLYVFEAGTTTPVTTYSDSAMTTAQAQPLVANSAGEFAGVFVPSGTYKIRVADSGAVVLYELDDVRMADRPDDPIYLDDFAAWDADETAYATGTVVITADIGSRYVQAASGATDHQITRADGAKFYVTAIDGALHISAFGASASNTYTANDTALQKACAALSSGDELRCDVMGTVKFSDATISVGNVKVNILPGCELQQDNAVLDDHALKITGDDVVVLGGGAISSEITQVSDYSVTGSGIARSIIHATGDNPIIDGIEIKTPSRCGVFFGGSLNPTMRNCWGNAGYNLSDYDGSTTLNLYAAYYDCTGGTSATTVYTVTGNQFQQYITPISGAALTSGTFKPAVCGNVIRNCWDHAFYLLSTVGGAVSENTTYDTRTPGSVDMNGVHYVNNKHFWSGTSGLNMEAAISMRNMRNGAICENNILEGGMGCYIDCRPVGATYDCEGISVSNNTLRPSVAASGIASSIRVENTSGTMVAPRVSGNTVLSQSNTFGGVIRVAGRSGTPATNPDITGNKVTPLGTAFGIQIDYCDDPDLSRNQFDRSGYSTAGTVDNIYGTNCNRPKVYDTRHVFSSGGSGVTLRPVLFNSTVNDADIADTDLRAATAPTVNEVTGLGTDGTLRRTRYSPDPMEFQIDLSSGSAASSYTVNANVLTTSSFEIHPVRGTGAAVHMDSTWVEARPDLAGQVRLVCGAAAASDCTFDVVIR